MPVSSTSGNVPKRYWNGGQDEWSDRLLRGGDQFGELPSEVIKGRTFEFFVVDRKHQFFGWSVKGEVVHYFPPHHSVPLEEVIIYYGVEDARVYARLVKPTPYMRFVVDQGNNQLCVVTYDRKFMRVRCLTT